MMNKWQQILYSPDDGAGAAAEPIVKGKVIGEVATEGDLPISDKASPLFGVPDDKAFFDLVDDEERDEATTAAKEAAKETTKTQPIAGDKPKVEEKPGQKPVAAAPKTEEVKPKEDPAKAATPEVKPAPVEGPAKAEVSPEKSRAAEEAEQSVLDVLDKNKDPLIAELGKMYALSKEDEEGLSVEPAPVLRKLAGQLHFNVLRAAMGMTMQMIPQLVQRTQEMVRVRTEMENKFFEAWPTLDRTADLPLIQAYSGVFWGANPKASVADFIKTVGSMVAAQTGKLVPGVPPAEIKPPAKQPAFVPAGSGGGTPRAQAKPKVDGDVWGNMADHLDNEDADT